MIKICDEAKAYLQEERSNVRGMEAKAVKDLQNLSLEVRELKVKLGTARMREEDNLRIIADMKCTMDLKKATNESLLERLTAQNENFKHELEQIGKQMQKMSKSTLEKPKAEKRPKTMKQSKS